MALAEARKFDPNALLALRLSPNLYVLAQQVGEACRLPGTGSALLPGRAPAALPALHHDVAALQAHVAASIAFIEGLPRPEIDASAERNVAFKLKSGVELPFTGRSLLLTFSVPQFFFHVTTAYDILRHAGVDLAKKDFLRRR